MGYIGRYKALLVVVAVCLVLSSLGNVAASYLLKPAINDYIIPGDFKGLFSPARADGRDVRRRGAVLVCLFAHHGAHRTADGRHAPPGSVRQAPDPAAALFRHPPVRRPDEPLHKRHRHRLRDDHEQPCEHPFERGDVRVYDRDDALPQLGTHAHHLRLPRADAAGRQDDRRAQPRELPAPAARARRRERLY